MMNPVNGKFVPHYLYIRAHEASPSDLQYQRAGKRGVLPPERTLFLVNLPIDATPLHIKQLFGLAGAVERVRFPRSFRVSDDGSQDLVGTAAGTEESEHDLNEEVRQRSAHLLADIPPAVPLPPLDARIPLSGSTTDLSPLLSSGSSAHVVFVETGSRNRALELARSGKLTAVGWPDPFAGLDTRTEPQPTGMDPGTKGRKHPLLTAAQAASEAGLMAPPTGLDYLVQTYRRARPPLAQVRAYADAAVLRSEYLRENPAAAEALEQVRGQVKRSRKPGIKAVARGPNGELLDEDGFVIVEGGVPLDHNKRGSSTRKRAAVEAEEGQTKPKKKKAADLEGFYKFQRTEKRRDELAALRDQFAKDTAKVAKLKQTRRFKPY